MVDRGGARRAAGGLLRGGAGQRPPDAEEPGRALPRRSARAATRRRSSSAARRSAARGARRRPPDQEHVRASQARRALGAGPDHHADLRLEAAGAANRPDHRPLRPGVTSRPASTTPSPPTRRSRSLPAGAGRCRQAASDERRRLARRMRVRLDLHQPPAATPRIFAPRTWPRAMSARREAALRGAKFGVCGVGGARSGWRDSSGGKVCVLFRPRHRAARGYGAVGSASRSQREGQGFESP